MSESPMAPEGHGSGLVSAGDVEIDPAQYALVLRRLELVSPALHRALRARLSDAIDLAREDARQIILAYPSRRFFSGMREALADSLETRIDQQQGGKVTRARVVSTGRLLGEQQKPLVLAMQALDFRHPVFAQGSAAKSRRGRRTVWVDQRGMRYFDYSRLQARLPRIRALMSDALDEATKGLQ